MKSVPALPRLHAITDERIARRPDLEEIAQRLALGGGDRMAFHARGRALSGLEHFELASRLGAYAPTRLFVNDRLDVALAVGAAGVQLGRGSLTPEDARRAAHAGGADYLLVGPVFPTATHPDRAPLGLAQLKEIVGVGLPVIAIGGVTPERIPELMAVATIYGVAAIRALWHAADPADAARRMVQELNR